MPRPPNPDKAKQPVDVAALNVLLHRIEQFFEANDLSGAGQKEKAKALGLTDQKYFSRLLARQHAPGIDKVQAISDATGIPVWRLLMPVEAEAAIAAQGVKFQDLRRPGNMGGALNAGDALGKGSQSSRPRQAAHAVG